MIQTKLLLFFSLAFLMLVAVLKVPAHAVTELDLTFGEDGVVVEDLGFGDDVILDAVVQKDGKILAAGYANNGAVTNVVVARYLSDGTLDVSFNDDGIFIVSLGAGDSKVDSLVLQSDGKSVLSGTINGDENKVVLLRLTVNGFLDPTFAEDGQVSFAVGSDPIEATQVKLTSDEEIIVAGTAAPEPSSEYAYVSKFTSNGLADTTFGSDGLVTFKKDDPVTLKTIEIVENNNILGTGSVTTGDEAQLLLIRWTTLGAVDTTFGSEGEKLPGFSGDDFFVNDSYQDSEGLLYLTGGQNNGTSTAAVVIKLDSSGTPVTAFGKNGIYRSDLGGDSVANDIVVLADGSIVIAGSVYLTGVDGQDLFIETIDKTGNPSEVTIGSEGESAEAELSLAAETEEDEDAEVITVEASTFVTTDFSSSHDIGYALAVSSDGDVIVAGSSNNGTDTDFVLLRYVSDVETSLVAGTISSGIITGEYKVVTRAVVDVNRVSAVSGGTISDTRTLSCNTSCTAACTDENDLLDETCHETCVTDCENRATVALRGVVYAVYDAPVYDAGSDSGTDDETDEGTEEDTSADDETDTAQIQAASEGNVFAQGETFTYEVVRSGQTEDGDGLGTYSSEILDITPNTTYFVRAYALLTDGTVIYGNVFSFKTADACFIATAAFGSILEPHVTVLREFRDSVLMDSRIGQQFVGLYYKFSPPLAAIVAENSFLRLVTRAALYPIIAGVAFVLYGSIALKILAFVGLLLAMLGYKNFRRCEKVG